MSTFWIILIQIITLSINCGSEKLRYFATERAEMHWYDTKYVRYANLTARRYGRRDPFYYVDLNFDWIHEFHNNITFNFYFFEFLTNRYARSFVEMHWKLCDLVWKDKIFGTAMRQGGLDRPCPFPAGAYKLSNMTIPIKHIPAHFPFKKGRIYCNVTRTVGGELIGWAHIDFEIKETRMNGTHRNWVDGKEQPGIA